uniref:Uncharacterized protein n=1 Tax=Kalanchoe fedtschenkoi TaxID=63787 RepID=A0A7N0ZZ26_KALFE
MDVIDIYFVKSIIFNGVMEDCSCVLPSQTSHQSFPSAFTSISISLPHRRFVSRPLPTPPSHSPTPDQPPRSPAPLYFIHTQFRYAPKFQSFRFCVSGRN